MPGSVDIKHCERGIRKVTYAVDTAVRAVAEGALAVGAGLRSQGAGNDDETEAGDGDHCGGFVWSRRRRWMGCEGLCGV